jgi:hypothetical protein
LRGTFRGWHGGQRQQQLRSSSWPSAPPACLQVLQYTSRTAAVQLEAALATWEAAAAAVAWREQLLQQLAAVRALVTDSERFQLAQQPAELLQRYRGGGPSGRCGSPLPSSVHQQLREISSRWPPPAAPASLAAAPCCALLFNRSNAARPLAAACPSPQPLGVPAMQAPPGTQLSGPHPTCPIPPPSCRLEELGPAVDVSQPQLVDLARAFLFATAQVEVAGSRLQQGCGQPLEVAGAAYPGQEALGAADVAEYLVLVLPHCFPSDEGGGVDL